MIETRRLKNVIFIQTFRNTLTNTFTNSEFTVGSVLNYKIMSDGYFIPWSNIRNGLLGLMSCSNAGCQMGD